jgi:hypothetical protein
MAAAVMSSSVPPTTNATPSTNDVPPTEVDLTAHPTAQNLVSRCRDFFSEVEDLYISPLILSFPSPTLIQPLCSNSTPGHQLEAYLNKNYGPGNPIYEDLCNLTRQGLKEGWVANFELDGAKYRRSKILLPSAENRFFSITTVYMESEEEVRFAPLSHHRALIFLSTVYADADSTQYSGQYHSHPYGEINCVVQIDKTAELKGMQGWQGAGWTSPGPGTHHYPEVRRGALIALFFLPAGRISYKAKPGDPQPASV